MSDPLILTGHAYPPIPVRQLDWMAYYDGHEEGPTGWGATEADAINDLVSNYEEPS